MNLRRILLVEDNPRDAEVMIAALKRSGPSIDFVHVRDGVQALDYLYRRDEYAARRNDLPAAVLLDLKMPRLGGLEVLEAMKSDPLLRIVPVVVISSSREEIDLRRCYELGANAYVVKPVSIPEFFEALHRLSAFWIELNEPPGECL